MNKGTLEMIAAMTICGTIGITVLASGQTELNLIFYRCLFGGVVLSFIVFSKQYLIKHFNLEILCWSLLGGAALLANWYFLFSAYRNTSVGVATAVYNTQPLMMIAFGIVLFKETVSASTWWWVAISLFGLTLISQLLDGTDVTLNARYLLGVVQALLAALLYAVAAIIARKLKSTPPALIAFLQLLLGVMLLAPFANFSVLTSPRFDVETLAIVSLGVVHTGLMYLLLYGAIQKIEAWRVASISFLYPAIALLLDSVFLKIHLSFSRWIGIALILLGAAGINLKWSILTPR